MANYRRTYNEEIFNCFPRLNQPIFTPFGSYIVNEVDPSEVEDTLMMILKTLISPKVIASDPRIFHILAESKMTCLEELLGKHIPPSIKDFHINSISLRRADCGPLRRSSNNNYLTFRVEGRKDILREALLLSLPDALGHSEEWVSLETLIFSGRLITGKLMLIKELLDPQLSVVKAEVELKEDEADGKLYIRCTGKKRRSYIDEKSEKEVDDWAGSWENLGVFDTLEEARLKVEALARFIHHMPSNAFIPIPVKDLFRGAILLHGNHHGLLISLQALVWAFRNRSKCPSTKITIRKSSYTLPVYNIPGVSKVLHVAFVRVVEDLEQQERRYYDMPFFLYDGREYNVRTRGAGVQVVTHFFDKIDVGAPDTSLPEYDCCQYELEEGSNSGCFQSASGECAFPEDPDLL